MNSTEGDRDAQVGTIVGWLTPRWAVRTLTRAAHLTLAIYALRGAAGCQIHSALRVSAAFAVDTQVAKISIGYLSIGLAAGVCSTSCTIGLLNAGAHITPRARKAIITQGDLLTTSDEQQRQAAQKQFTSRHDGLLVTRIQSAQGEA